MFILLNTPKQLIPQANFLVVGFEWERNLEMEVDELKTALNKTIKHEMVCKNCAHKNVCKLIDTDNSPCAEYLNNGSHEIYGHIYDMFEPIFKWLKKHYPSGGVRFVVEQNKAQMYLEHGVSVYSKELKNMCCVDKSLLTHMEVGQEETKNNE